MPKPAQLINNRHGEILVCKEAGHYLSRFVLDDVLLDLGLM